MSIVNLLEQLDHVEEVDDGLGVGFADECTDEHLDEFSVVTELGHLALEAGDDLAIGLLLAVVDITKDQVGLRVVRHGGSELFGQNFADEIEVFDPGGSDDGIEDHPCLFAVGEDAAQAEP